MKWYIFDQNNSGGSFSGPAINVFIQAQSANVARAIAEDNDLYFNGVDNGDDCPCCGDRWHEPWDEDGEDEPLINGETPAQFVDPTIERRWRNWYWGQRRNIPEVLLIHADGRREEFFAPKE